MSTPEDYRQVAERLSRNIEALVWELLPAGRKENGCWRIGSLAGEAGASMSVVLTGPKRGRWRDFASGEGGDALDLVAECRFQGDRQDAFAWAQQWTGIAVEPRPAAAKTRSANPARTNLGKITERWEQAWPLRRGDPVDRYLLGRAIDLAKLGRAPRALRYHPALWNRERAAAGPAMVAAITSLKGQLLAVHRTWLDVNADGVTKAALKEPKMTWGFYLGGGIRLWRGASGLPWQAMPDGETVMIGEGLEDTLSAITLWPCYRALCAVSLSAMLATQLPPAAATVLILQQNDHPKSTAADLLGRVVQRWRGEGRAVRVLRPPGCFKDVNDLARWARSGSPTPVEIALTL